MVFMLKESKARIIFENYENVAAFTLGKAKGISENDLEVSYRKLPIIPDDDTINAVLNGDVKGKKIIKAAVKALHRPEKEESQDICTNMCLIVNMIDPEKVVKKKSKKKTDSPNIVVFVYDDELDDAGKARIKFLYKYLSALFEEFGLKVFTAPNKKETKFLKKIFDGKRKKVIAKVADLKASRDGAHVSRKGHTLKKLLLHFYAIELHQSALSSIGIGNMTSNEVRNLIHDLLYIYTNDNLKISADVKEKQRKKLCKTLREKNRQAVEAYKILANIIHGMDPMAKGLPKVKSGYKKDKPKMNTKKFEKFFSKTKNISYLALVYAHTACYLLGLEVGSSEYNKIITAVLRDTAIDSKQFVAAAKAYGK